MTDRSLVARAFTSVQGLVVMLTAVIALGLTSRRVFSEVPILGAELGDALYAVTVYLAIRLVVLVTRPTLPVPTAVNVAALCAGLTCGAVELFQRTDLPRQLAARPRSGRFWALVLGRGFRWWDLAALALGVIAIALIDRHLSRGVRRSAVDRSSSVP